MQLAPSEQDMDNKGYLTEKPPPSYQKALVKLFIIYDFFRIPYLFNPGREISSVDLIHVIRARNSKTIDRYIFIALNCWTWLISQIMSNFSKNKDLPK